MLFFEKSGQGPALLILHGLFGSGDNWRSVMRPLTTQLTLYYLDQRNHGRSPHLPTNTYPEMAADLLELMDAEGLDTALLLGHSMGGKTVMEFALSYPERVQKLIVADMGIKAYPPHHDNIIAGLNAVHLPALHTRQDAEAALALHIEEVAVRQFLMKSLYRLPEGGFAWRFNLPVLEQRYDDILQPIQLHGREPYAGDTLFIRGELSNYVQDAAWPAIQALFPKAELTTLAGAGHWVHAEKPVQFLQLVSSFLGVQLAT